eukprot:UN3272
MPALAAVTSNTRVSCRCSKELTGAPPTQVFRRNSSQRHAQWKHFHAALRRHFEHRRFAVVKSELHYRAKLAATGGRVDVMHVREHLLQQQPHALPRGGDARPVISDSLAHWNPFQANETCLVLVQRASQHIP